ncbi:serine/threonine-protein kinase BLUS1-like isoform X2 [Canna indica]|uniref:Serine/threonine-protein kinase BLUS1-like isoform X2 n=1 Tax=Canna indica TaxID=4628 RepID=A0AAQ3L2T2_9LILI|nr:serine/threonine-protein kinase BLUS1-like isoform X2 [Canna indica]
MKEEEEEERIDSPAGVAAGKKPMDRKKYPIHAEDYQLYEPVGQGVSASVYRALCVPLNEVVAIKIVDFERNNSDLNNICREAQTMILIDHPNVLKAHCSFVNDRNLWVVMPYMEGGSCLHIMKSVFPNGFEEPVIATILREVLKGLEYLHNHGHIHRDVKAGNILVDARGTIKLGDFGVSACLFDSGDRQRSRNTFVGTPCWMAPEVMEQLHGYDFKADIWSFGITALELAHGHAPFSKYPPIKVLLMTLQNAPPGLDYERDKKFSKSFKDMISMCLVKDPSKRPSAHKLLKQAFFKQARSQDYIVRKVLDGLPTLVVRHQALKDKEEDLLAQKKMRDCEKEELSQSEYKRGISAWNFDMDELKTQASMIPGNEETKDSNGCQVLASDALQVPEAAPCSSLKGGDDDTAAVPLEPMLLSLDQPESYQRNKSDASDNEFKVAVTSDQNSLQKNVLSNREGNESNENCRQEFDEKHLENLSTHSCHERRLSTNMSSFELIPSSKGESLRKNQNQIQNNEICNGEFHRVTDTPTDAVPKPSKLTGVDDGEDKSKHPLVQRKGRFKVMSESVDFDKALPPVVLQKSQSLQMLAQLPSPSIQASSDAPLDLCYSIYPQLHSILQANILQRDYILSLMRQLSTSELSSLCIVASNRSVEEKSSMEAANDREKELIQEICELHCRLISTQDELKRLKARNVQASALHPFQN